MLVSVANCKLLRSLMCSPTHGKLEFYEITKNWRPAEVMINSPFSISKDSKIKQHESMLQFLMTPVAVGFQNATAVY